MDAVSLSLRLFPNAFSKSDSLGLESAVLS